MKYLLLIVFIVASNAGYAQHANEHMNQTPFAELVKQMERPDRDLWQKPDEVMKLLGPLQGKKIVDIGCGTGYFTFRLQDAGATVIAADIDDRFLKYVDSVRKARNISDKRVITRKLEPNDPGLQKKEADIVIVVNTYHHIEDRVEYFKKVKAGMKNLGFLMVIDYFKKDLPVGPPASMKMAAEEIVRELSQAGFAKFKTDETTLPYQYILFAL